MYNADVTSLRANPSTLLEIDAAANLALGALLLASPSGIMRLLGLPSTDHSFYSRVLGGVLSGIGLALLSTRFRFPESGSGLGRARAVAINLSGAVSVIVTLIKGGLDIPVRGRVALWALAGFLVGLSGLELQTRRGFHSSTSTSLD